MTYTGQGTAQRKAFVVARETKAGVRTFYKPKPSQKLSPRISRLRDGVRSESKTAHLRFVHSETQIENENCLFVFSLLRRHR